MKIFAITVESLGFSSGANFHTQRGVYNGITGVSVPGLPIIVVGSLVNEDRGKFSSQGVD